MLNVLAVVFCEIDESVLPCTAAFTCGNFDTLDGFLFCVRPIGENTGSGLWAFDWLRPSYSPLMSPSDEYRGEKFLSLPVYLVIIIAEPPLFTDKGVEPSFRFKARL